MGNIELCIPEKIAEQYNYSLFELKKGGSDYYGNENELLTLSIVMEQDYMPNAFILGKQGVGKTRLVEQYIYEESKSNQPVIIVGLSIETLGIMPENVVIGRIRTLLDDMVEIQKATIEKNETDDFRMYLFIDEMHKLERYGYVNGSSGAINALKESTARGVFPVILTTTEQEYLKHIAPDRAFDRRFTNIVLREPNKESVIKILDKRLEYLRNSGKFVPKKLEPKFYDTLYDLCDKYIVHQAFPDKGLSKMAYCISYCKKMSQITGKEVSLGREALKHCFGAEGFNIDASEVDIDELRKEFEKNLLGQPLAINNIIDNINALKYSKIDRGKVILSLFSVGTTGTGKTESAKILAKMFFGDANAIVHMNGGDYPMKEDAMVAQRKIGDEVAVDKQKVILLDEIEKSHKSVISGYLKMVDEGIVLDSQGIERSICNTIIVATSNLGAQIFTDLYKEMKLGLQENPNLLTEELLSAWHNKEGTLKKALLHGNVGENNGIKPEFLERFSILNPYLPLSKISMAQIMRLNLKKYKEEMASIGYDVKTPRARTKEEWEKYIGKSKYDDLDEISVMVAEDIVSTEGDINGARTISRFIKGSIRVKMGNKISQIEKKGLSIEKGFLITTNGNATFENNNRKRPDVKVWYYPEYEEYIRKLEEGGYKRG